MSGRAGGRADDLHSGRQPTSHEQRAGQPWEASYLDGPAPWDIGEPQPAIMRLAGEGAFVGSTAGARSAPDCPFGTGATCRQMPARERTWR